MYLCYCFHLKCQIRNDKIKTIFSVLNRLSNAGAGARALRPVPNQDPANRRRPELSKICGRDVAVWPIEEQLCTVLPDDFWPNRHKNSQKSPLLAPPQFLLKIATF